MSEYLTLALLVWVIGLLMWGLFPRPSNPPQYLWLSEVGRVMFWVGLLAWLLNFGGHHVG